MAFPLHDRRFVMLLVVLLLMVSWCAHSTSAAGPGDDTDPLWIPVAIVDDGIRRNRDDAWSLGKSILGNPTDQPITLMLALTVGDAPNLQFLHEVSMWPHSHRQVWTPYKPIAIPEDATLGVEARALLYDAASMRGTPRLMARPAPGTLMIDRGRPGAAILSDGGDRESENVATAMRFASGLSQRLYYLARHHNSAIPPIYLPVEGADTIVISHDDPPLDTAQLESLRRWLIRGGRLWIMAEQVDEAFSQRLLGDLWNIHIIDHVQMNEVVIEGDRNTSRQTFEEPVAMARVIAPDWQVVHQTRGFPASMFRSVGRGLVLVTTVGPRGWYRMGESAVEPLPTLQDLGGRFNGMLNQSPLSDQALATHARSYIGYKIVSRSAVMAVMTAFIVLMIALGIWLDWRGRLERIGLVGVVAAAAVALILVAMGKASRSVLPLTMSQGQFIQVASDSQYAIVQAALGLYSPTGLEGRLQGQGGMAWPDLRLAREDQIRLKWTDFDRWQWEGLELPSGAVLDGRAENIMPLTQPVSADAAFGKDGVVGQIQRGPFTGLHDVIIATRSGIVAVDVGDGGSFTAGRVLPPGEYGAGGLIDESQRRRHELLDQLLLSNRIMYPQTPTLLGWAEPMGIGVTLPVEHELTGAALVAMPLNLRRAAPGDIVRIPSAFLPFELQRGTTYDPIRREWLDVAQQAAITLRYVLPEAVQPLRITAARLVLDISAAGRMVRIHAGEGRNGTLLAEESSPIGRIVAEIGDQLQPDENGSVMITLQVGDAGGETSLWRIRNVTLQVDGQVLESVNQAP